MNKKKRYKYLIIVYILSTICIFAIVKMQKPKKIQDDILFVFDVSENKTQEKVIDFSNDILANDILIEEKVAPGASGNFGIKLKTNKDIKYKVYFQSENEKPKNLVFKVGNDEKYYDNLETISNNLIGTLNKNEECEIPINWKWEYYQTEEQDIQDTQDGKKIEQYRFKIIVKVD